MEQVEQLACIMELQGVPPRHLIEQASRRKMFFDSNGAPKIVANSRGKKRRPSTKDLASVLRCNDAAFVSFLDGCLQWDKNQRFSPDQALQHEWITEVLLLFFFFCLRAVTHASRVRLCSTGSRLGALGCSCSRACGDRHHAHEPAR